MRELAIACGDSRQAKNWVNRKTTFEDLKKSLEKTHYTTETVEEYARMTRAQRDQAKDHGGFVGGILINGRRRVDTVESRSMISLDGDRINVDYLEHYEERMKTQMKPLSMPVGKPLPPPSLLPPRTTSAQTAGNSTATRIIRKPPKKSMIWRNSSDLTGSVHCQTWMAIMCWINCGRNRCTGRSVKPYRREKRRRSGNERLPEG